MVFKCYKCMLVRVTSYCIINSEMFWKLLWFFINFSFCIRTWSFVSLRNIIIFRSALWNFVINVLLSAKTSLIFDNRMFSTSFWSLSKNSFLTILDSIDCIMSYNAFSKGFKCSFCGGVARDLKPKRFYGSFSGFSFSLQK